MDRHTLEHERAAALHSIDIATRAEQYHLAGARRDHDRAQRLTNRVAEIDAELSTATHDCTCQ